MDVVPVGFMECSNRLKGFVRCDQIFLTEKNDGFWRRYLFSLSAADMAVVEGGLKAALGLP